MPIVRLILTFIASLLCVSLAHARLESSTALLLRAPEQAPSIDDLDRDVYRVRAKPARVRRPSAAIVITNDPPSTADAPVVIPTEPRDVPAEPARTPATDETSGDESRRDDDLTVRVSAGYFANDADSSSPARDHATRGPAVGMGATLWLRNDVGVRAEYLAAAALDRRHADVERVDLGLRLRRSRDLHFGVGYHQSSITYARTTRDAVDQRVRGLDLGVELARPTSTDYVHQFEVHARPLMSDRAIAASLVVGGRYAFERGPRAFWRAEYVWERGHYADATVTSGMSLIRIGAEWGS